MCLPGLRPPASVAVIGHSAQSAAGARFSLPRAERWEVAVRQPENCHHFLAADHVKVTVADGASVSVICTTDLVASAFSGNRSDRYAPV